MELFSIVAQGLISFEEARKPKTESLGFNTIAKLSKASRASLTRKTLCYHIRVPDQANVRDAFKHVGVQNYVCTYAGDGAGMRVHRQSYAQINLLRLYQQNCDKPVRRG